MLARGSCCKRRWKLTLKEQLLDYACGQSGGIRGMVFRRLRHGDAGASWRPTAPAGFPAPVTTHCVSRLGIGKRQITAGWIQLPGMEADSRRGDFPLGELVPCHGCRWPLTSRRLGRLFCLFKAATRDANAINCSITVTRKTSLGCLLPLSPPLPTHPTVN